MKIKIFIIFIFPFLTACNTNFDYVRINGEEGVGKEISFLSAVIQESKALEEAGLRLLREDIDSNVPVPSLIIDFFSSWEHEYDYEYITVSKTFFVPIDDPLSARTDTNLAACLNGKETLIPVEELDSPYVALRVDGITINEDEYPLIRFSGIKIRSADEKKINKRLEKKLLLMTEEIKNARNPLIHDCPSPIWLVAGGDVMLERGATELLLDEGPKGIFGETAGMIFSADIALLNLEGVISRKGKKVPKTYNFRFIPEVAEALRAAGVDAVLHANNHVFDYGEDAFLDSLSWLEQAEIGVIGAGKNIEDASRSFVFSNGKEKIHVYGLASFPRERNGWDGVTAAAEKDTAGMLHSGKGGREKLKERFLSSDADVTNILFFHGGTEWSIHPDASTRELYTDLINAGADIVIGSHPHVVQGFEWVNGKPVFWSLGNYVFGGMTNFPAGEEGLFIRLGILNGRLLYLEPFHLVLKNIRTDISPPEKLANFYKRSEELRKQNTY